MTSTWVPLSMVGKGNAVAEEVPVERFVPKSEASVLGLTMALFEKLAPFTMLPVGTTGGLPPMESVTAIVWGLPVAPGVAAADTMIVPT